MSMRASSLQATNTLAINREIDSKYDAVLAVRDKLTEVELVAGLDIDGLIAELESAQDFTGITVVQGSAVGWDPINKVLTVVKGDKGDTGAQGIQGIQGIQGERGIQGIQGTKGDTGAMGATGPRGLTGDQGIQGPAGNDGQDLTVEQISYSGNGTFVWQFSDGTSYTTPSLMGPKGDIGLPGVKGDQGVSVHHIKGTSTTDSEGDFATYGEIDTYTVYGDAAETINLGNFRVNNGAAKEGQYSVMYESTYDTDGSGVVDNAEKLEGKTVVEIQNEILDTKGQPLGIATLDIAGLVPVSQLPSYVDDCVIVNTKADLPVVGEYSKIYIVIADESSNGDTSSYRWAGSTYAMVSNTLNAADVKALYESNPNTNAFTDALKTKLDGIESGATADQTGSEIQALYEAQADKVLVEVNKIGISLDAGIAVGIGEIAWNSNENTIDVGLNGATLQVGQEQLIRVRNNSGATISNGMAVMATGALGNSGRITVAKANLNQSNAKRILGVVTETIASGADGFVTTFGKVRGIQTDGANYGESWVDGDTLYVKDSDNGALTNVIPTDTQVKLPVAFVVNAHGSNGVLFVRVNSIDENHSKVELAAKADKVSVYTKTESDANYEPKNSNIQAHIGSMSNPHGVTKTQVGLGNVDNTSDANKPVSTAQQNALNLKLDSSVYTASDVLTKIKTVDGTGSGLDADLLDGNDSSYFATASGLSGHAGRTDNPHSVTKAQVGLSSVDNTADSTKNVLSATKLATARTINGVAFDGTADITVADSTKAPLTGIGASGTWGINITGNAATATTATTASNATKLNNVAEDVDATANTIVKRDGNGYIKGVYFHTTAADTTTVASNYFVETGGDGYIRPKPLASVKAEIAGDRAPLVSPALTGTPTAPTAATGSNTTQIATTAFVNSAIAASGGSVGGSTTFTASGTWTCPAGVYTAFVRVLGGGGGGSGTEDGKLYPGGGGGSAVENTAVVKVTPGTAYAITIGAGGAGGSTVSNGGDGGNSSALGITGYGGAGGLRTYVAGSGKSARVVPGGPGVGSETPFSGFAAGSGASGGCAIWMNVVSDRAAANVAATLPGQGGGAGTSSTNFTAVAGKAGFRGQVYICW